MKRFLLFAGDNYYPERLQDLIKDYDTEAEAREVGIRLTQEIEYGRRDWYEILDTEGELPFSYSRRNLETDGVI